MVSLGIIVEQVFPAVEHCYFSPISPYTLGLNLLQRAAVDGGSVTTALSHRN